MAYSEKFKFDKNRKRVKFCPCGESNKNGKFAPFEGYDDKGYCHSCDKTFKINISKAQSYSVGNPKIYFKRTDKIEESSTIYSTHLENSVSIFKSSFFIHFLYRKFDVEIANEVIGKYFIGSSNYREGSTVFWQIDKNLNIRGGKIMQYDPFTGRRRDTPTWVHSAMNLQNFNLSQCFFGEHLLKGNNNSVIIVESEKTAVISSVYMPKYVWLATGGKNNLKEKYFYVLKNRKVVLMPDTDAYEEWRRIVKGFKSNRNLIVSDLLESIATEEEREAKWDIADYLLSYPVKNFKLDILRLRELGDASPICKSTLLEPVTSQIFKYENPKEKKVTKWDDQIKELEDFYSKISLPTGPIKLNTCSVITNLSIFLEGHFATIHNYNGKKLALPYIERLVLLKIKLMDD